MKKEFVEYATYTLLYRNSKKSNRSFFFSDVGFGVGSAIMLVISSVPFLAERPVVWFLLFFVWGGMLICRKKEKNQYMKAILIDGMFVIYGAIFLSHVLVDVPLEKAETSCLVPLIFLSVFNVLIYEIVVLIKVKKRKYSYHKQIALSKEEKNNYKLIILVSSIGACCGVFLSRATSHLVPFSTSQMIFVVGLSFLWLFGFLLLQKYFILKILKHQQINTK